MLKTVLFFIISISALKSEQDISEYAYYSFSIPGGVISQALSLISSGGPRNNFECYDYRNLPFTQQDLKYRLYTREFRNRDALILTTDNLVNLDNLDKRKATKIILPGWLADDKQRAIQQLIDSFLHRYDCNVITIDYNKFSFTYYKTAFCNVKKASELLGDFLCELELDFNRVHILGHSIGGQLAGLIGQRVKAKCNKVIDRITGLDPAGLIYQHLDRTQRLDKEDARFVDVIHSNMGIYGYYGSTGHVDFYAYGGRFRSNCVKTKESSSFLDLLVLPASLRTHVDYIELLMINVFNRMIFHEMLVLCSHVRSIEYFADSILGPKSMFRAKSCTLTPKHLPIGTCLRNKKSQYNTLGEDCARNSSGTEFIWQTNQN